MRKDLSNLYGAVVRIVGSAGSHRVQPFLGTALVVSPNTVITCAHVLEELIELDPDRGKHLMRPSVLCGSTTYRATGTRTSDRLDLCALRFPRLPSIKLAVPARAGKLKGRKLVALGFDGRDPDRVTEVHGITVLNEGLSENRNQWAQVAGGFPHGFSGAPVLTLTDTGWTVVGIVHIGGDEAATSRVIGADAIVNFLADEGSEPS